MTLRARRGRWTVVALNGTVAAAVLVLVAVLALVVNPPSPPGIAAFAPRASKPITKAPQNQGTRFGTGAGECGQGQVCAHGTPVASAVPTAVPTAAVSHGAAPAGLQCYEWPGGLVTQTFDPQSPPCIATWDDRRGNGGATAPGVSGTEIRVALPQRGSSSTWPALRPLVDYVNTRFQLYGRKITIVPFPSQQADQQAIGNPNDPQAQRADAAAVTSLEVFASLDFLDPLPSSSTLPVFVDTLAKHKIISIAGGDNSPYLSVKELEKNAPYAWSYQPPLDRLMTNVGAMTCLQLVGKPAEHAPDPDLRSKTRKFALLLPTDAYLGGPPPGLPDLLAQLDGCGVHDPKVVRWDADDYAPAGLAPSFQQLALDGVTSVIYLNVGGSGTPASPLVQATNANFRPEWVLMGWNQYMTAYLLNDSTLQTSGAFGVGVWNKETQAPLEMWNQAYASTGSEPLSTGIYNARGVYHELLLLASGVQLAGPHLTPESFAEGLRATTFPNPGAGRGPFYQATVGFGQGPIMVNDFNAFWLDTRTTGAEISNSSYGNSHRAFCYVQLGRRREADSWPSTGGFYRPSICR